MSDEAAEARVREALMELQQYLSDAVAPLVVADAVALLIHCPPEMVAAEIEEWMTAQYRGGKRTAPVSDYLYHAARKLHVLGEYRLVPNEELDVWLNALKPALLSYCPAEDREHLRAGMERLGDAQLTSIAPPVTILHRQAGSESPLAFGDVPAAAEEIAGGSRRLSTLVKRLEHLAASAALVHDAVMPATVGPELVAAAMGGAQTPDEFQHLRDRLQQRGVSPTTEEVIRFLASRLAPWGIVPPAPSPGEVVPRKPAGVAETMRRFVAFQDDPQEAAKRFHELVKTAIDEVNSGALSRAVTMLDVADRLLAEKKVDSVTAQAARERAHELLDTNQLRKLAEDPATQVALRRVLAFFPAFAPATLCIALQGEDRRERRRVILALLEAYGEEARPEVLKRLEESVAQFGDRDVFFQRNLLYLLRRVPRPAGAGGEGDVELVCRLSEPARPLPLLKEVIANLAQLKEERAEQALVRLLAGIEGMLLRPAEAAHPIADLLALLDRVVFALARRGTPAALRAVVDHGLKRQPQLGDTLKRMSCLGTQDLSTDPELVARLVRTLVMEVPRRVLGILIPKRGADLVSLVAAVSGTRTPEVRAALTDIAKRFPSQEFAVAAAKAIADMNAVAAAAETAPTKSMSGDLDLFGLPTLLQNLAGSDASGLLTLNGGSGQVMGQVVLADGRVQRCRLGSLRGAEALYQIIEEPEPATFVFVSPWDSEGDDEPDFTPPHETLPLLFEGMRRYDELQVARSVVADDAVLRATGAKPTRLQDEADKAMLSALWGRAISGLPASQCEAEVVADRYRTRRMLAHWVEEGSLELR